MLRNNEHGTHYPLLILIEFWFLSKAMLIKQILGHEEILIKVALFFLCILNLKCWNSLLSCSNIRLTKRTINPKKQHKKQQENNPQMTANTFSLFLYCLVDLRKINCKRKRRKTNRFSFESKSNRFFLSKIAARKFFSRFNFLFQLL